MLNIPSKWKNLKSRPHDQALITAYAKCEASIKVKNQ